MLVKQTIYLFFDQGFKYVSMTYCGTPDDIVQPANILKMTRVWSLIEFSLFSGVYLLMVAYKSFFLTWGLKSIFLECGPPINLSLRLPALIEAFFCPSYAKNTYIYNSLKLILNFYFYFKITNFKLPVIDPMQKGGKKSKKITKTIFLNAQLGNCTFNTLNYNILTFLI
jgi:hypothetical protein